LWNEAFGDRKIKKVSNRLTKHRSTKFQKPGTRQEDSLNL